MSPPSLAWPQALLLVGAGALAGFINVVAGGGSLLTLPALLFLGLPAPVANATNRISLILQNVSASTAFRRGGRLPLGLTVRLAVAALPGAAVGARVALEVDETTFRRVLAAILLLVLVAILRGSRRDAPTDGAVAPLHPRALYAAFFAMGLYAGFIQAGLGFLLIASLTNLGGLDLVRSNAVKVAVVLVLQILALAIFQAAGTVDWWGGLTLGGGSMLGAWVAARWQMRRGSVWVRRLLVGILILVAIRLLQESF
jgi:uncharacterized membrane protein YfcA